MWLTGQGLAVLWDFDPRWSSPLHRVQYVGTEDGEKPGYKDDDGVPEDSRTPTFCQATLRINNERWSVVSVCVRGCVCGG